MKQMYKFTVLLITIIAIGCKENISHQKYPDMKPPVVQKKPHTLTTHNHNRTDNYYWLNDRNNADVIAYLEAENAYTDTMMAHTKGLQDTLYNEMVSRLNPDEQSAPYPRNGYYYYTRYEAGKEYPLHCRKKGDLNGTEEIMLNVNELAKGHDYCQAGSLTVSPNNQILAYGIDTVSRRKYALQFKDLATGKIYDDKIDNTSGGAVWANDNKTVFYSRKDTVTLREYQIYKHILGTPVAADVLVYEEKDETFSINVWRDKSGKYIVISSYSTVSNEYQILSADQPNGTFSIFEPRQRGLEYSIDCIGDKFLILTNADGAYNFKLMETPINATGKKNWKEIIPHSDSSFLESVEVFKNYWVVGLRKNGLQAFMVNDVKSNTRHFVTFDEATYSLDGAPNEEFDTPLLRFEYSSLASPPQTIDYNMSDKSRTIVKKQTVPNYDASKYEVVRLYATATDGTKIPISLVKRKDVTNDGTAPLLLYAYGSYGYSYDPSFSQTRFSLIDRGFMYAIAHIRGGQEMGRQWYENGKLMKKKNTFTDFNDCAQYLIQEKYAHPSKVFALGGSAGGLLMGAIVNMRPDLYRGVIAAVPFVDVVTTMLDESIPLTTGEFDEWGNPKDSAYYWYMLSYSPYDQVKAQNYPALLVTTGLHDSQVQYWEPAKWVAKLRDMKTDNNLLLLETNMKTGHGGSSGRYDRYRETALEYAFLIDLLR